MALALLRRRSPEPHKLKKKKNPHASPPPPRTCLPSLSSLIFLLCVPISIWCFSTLLSDSFHICISSRKIKLYCISGTTTSSLGLAVDLPGESNNHVSVDEESNMAVALRDLENQLQLIRSWNSSTTNSYTNRRSCDGRGVFVYDLPPKFNTDITAGCEGILPWADLCEFFSNGALGEPIHGIGPRWHRTHQYLLEPIFHRRILNHPCRVLNPDDAKLFYVPYYGGLDVLRWNFKNVSVEVKDALGIELIRWLENQTSWRQHGGKNHMFVLGKISWDFRRRDEDNWGSNFLKLKEMNQPYKFLIEREPWKANEIGIPHPTHFHPHKDGDILQCRAQTMAGGRISLVSFAGAARPEAKENIRSVLIMQCMSSPEHCEFLDCAMGKCGDPEAVIMLFRRSEFCLQPPGDSPTRKSVFDSLVSGCIPVLFDPFTAYYQYPWHLPEDHRKYSVFIDQEEVRQGKVNVVEKLKEIPAKEREEMRRYIVHELMPGLVYGGEESEFSEFRDAFTIVMDNMLNLVTSSMYLGALNLTANGAVRVVQLIAEFKGNMQRLGLHGLSNTRDILIF